MPEIYENEYSLPKTSRRWLLILVAGAFVIRLIYNVWWVGIDDRPFSDAEEYHEIAIELIEHGTYTRIWRPPLFPVVIAGLYHVFGVHPFVVRIVLSMIGAATCWIIFLIGREAFEERIGWYAAWTAAVYGMLFQWNGYLLTETLFTFLLCLFVLFLLKGGRLPRHRYWLLGGVCLGLATLARPLTLMFLPWIPVWAVIVFPGHLKRAVIAACMVVVTMLAVLSPWTVRNYFFTDAFVPVSTMGGHVLLGANNPKVLESFEGGWIHASQTGLIDEAELEGLSLVEVDRLRQRRALEFILQNPLYFAKLCVYKFKLFWHLNRATDPVSLQYLCVLICAAVGAFSARKAWRHISILYLVPVFFTLAILVFWGDDRIRSPIEPILLVFGAYGAEMIRRAISSGIHVRPASGG